MSSDATGPMAEFMAWRADCDKACALGEADGKAGATCEPRQVPKDVQRVYQRAYFESLEVHHPDHFTEWHHQNRMRYLP